MEQSYGKYCKFYKKFSSIIEYEKIIIQIYLVIHEFSLDKVLNNRTYPFAIIS